MQSGTMFVLVLMKDTVRIPPSKLHLDTTQTIVGILNKKFANKISSQRVAFKLLTEDCIVKKGNWITWVHDGSGVVHNVGLCIALWDIEKYERSFIYPGDGATHTIVHFRYVVFRPTVDEILVGKVKNCSKEGISVSMGFFDDIFIPEDNLPHPSKFSETEQMWAWKYEEHDLYIEIGHEIRFRVMEEKFVDTSPTGPEGITMETTDPEPGPKRSPYTIVGTLAEQGLGLLSWWASAAGGEESAG